MTELKPPPEAPESSNLGLIEKTLEIAGRGSFIFRELSVQENDDCREASIDANKEFNGRTMMRLMIVTAAVSPKITLDQLGKLPQRIYAKIVDFVDALNDADALDQETKAAGNS